MRSAGAGAGFALCVAITGCATPNTTITPRSPAESNVVRAAPAAQAAQLTNRDLNQANHSAEVVREHLVELVALGAGAERRHGHRFGGVDTMVFAVDELAEAKVPPPFTMDDLAHTLDGSAIAHEFVALPPPEWMGADASIMLGNHSDHSGSTKVLSINNALGTIHIGDPDAPPFLGAHGPLGSITVSCPEENLPTSMAPQTDVLLPLRWEVLRTTSNASHAYEIVDGWFEPATCRGFVARRTTVPVRALAGGLMFAFRENCPEPKAALREAGEMFGSDERPSAVSPPPEMPSEPASVSDMAGLRLAPPPVPVDSRVFGLARHLDETLGLSAEPETAPDTVPAAVPAAVCAPSRLVVLAPGNSFHASSTVGGATSNVVHLNESARGLSKAMAPLRRGNAISVRGTTHQHAIWTRVLGLPPLRSGDLSFSLDVIHTVNAPQASAITRVSKIR